MTRLLIESFNVPSTSSVIQAEFPWAFIAVCLAIELTDILATENAKARRPLMSQFVYRGVNWCRLCPTTFQKPSMAAFEGYLILNTQEFRFLLGKRKSMSYVNNNFFPIVDVFKEFELLTERENYITYERFSWTIFRWFRHQSDTRSHWG